MASDHGAHVEPDYIKIFWWLFGLTALEVSISYVPGSVISRWAIGFCLVVMAFVKAGMVAAFYMHLKMEGRLLYGVCAVPIVLVAILTMGLTPDVANRKGATTRQDAPVPHASASPGAAEHTEHNP